MNSIFFVPPTAWSAWLPAGGWRYNVKQIY